MNLTSLRIGQNISAVTGASDVHDRPISFSVADGVISKPGQNGPRPADAVDAKGWMALPPMADVHAHIDKAFTWNEEGRPQGTLE